MPVPEGMVDDELRVWSSMMVETMRLVGFLDERLTLEDGVSYAEYRTMINILRDGPQRMSDLAQEGLVSRSGISRQVARLVALGYVEQFTEVNDGRSRLVRLTQDGRDVVTKATTTHSARVRQLLFDLLDDEEVRTLDVVYSKVGDSLTRKLQ